jgi:outer membrane protein assembly factor BamB
MIIVTLVGFGSIFQATTMCGVAHGADAIQVASTDWPWWRGLTRDGVASQDQNPPTAWSESKNVIWKAAIAGRGHASPTIVGAYVYLPTADEQRQIQSVYCFARATGELVWKTDVHVGHLVQKSNKKASQASSSIACDGHRLYVNFVNQGAVITTALDLQGKTKWQTRISSYVTHQGYGASPAIYKDLVIVAADNKGGGAIAALDRESGNVVWKHARPKKPNYPSPIILHVAGRDQLLLTGCDLVSSYDPVSGNRLWEIAGATTECVSSTVTDGQRIFTSGGYPKNHLSAVEADGSGKIAWERPVRVYVTSLLMHQGHLYGVTDASVAMCWNPTTGETLWKSRLGGTFFSSPVLVGKLIYATNLSGQTFVYKAQPSGFELVAENKLGHEVYATPAICGGQIFTRVAYHNDGRRDEVLYCLGTDSSE